MSEIKDALQEAFEDEEYEVKEIGVNRGNIRIGLAEVDTDPDELIDIVESAVDEENILGIVVDTESRDGSDELVTVISFRYRE